MKYCTVKSQIAETHLSPASREQTNSRKRANQGTAVEERGTRHFNCSSKSEPESEEPGGGTESGICDPEDITSIKQCTTGTNHHPASVWIPEKRDNVSSNPYQTHYICLSAPINVIGWFKNKQTNKNPSKDQQRQATLCEAGEAEVVAHLSIVYAWFIYTSCIGY